MEYEFRHVLWIGGPSGSGKTTIGRRLAVRHGLRYVGTDKLMQEHHRRGVARRLPGMTRWEQLTPDERWLTDPTEMASLLFAIGDESWSLLLEDLNTIPTHPGVVVEGKPLRPSLVAPVSRERRNAVWILPTEEAQLRNLDVRGASARSLASDPGRARQNRLQRELLVARQLRTEAEQLDRLTGGSVVATISTLSIVPWKASLIGRCSWYRAPAASRSGPPCAALRTRILPSISASSSSSDRT